MISTRLNGSAFTYTSPTSTPCYNTALVQPTCFIASPLSQSRSSTMISALNGLGTQRLAQKTSRVAPDFVVNKKVVQPHRDGTVWKAHVRTRSAPQTQPLPSYTTLSTPGNISRRNSYFENEINFHDSGDKLQLMKSTSDSLRNYSIQKQTPSQNRFDS